ncbi:hypothetical protein ACE6H2_015971 [Prunus campanulata]
MVVSCFFSLNSFNLYSSLRKALRVVKSRFYAEEDTDAYGLKVDVKKFLFDMRMHAKVIVVTMKSLDAQANHGSPQDE